MPGNGRTRHHPDDLDARRGLAAELRATRQRLGMSQQDVADDIGTVHQMIRGVEGFGVRDWTLQRIQRHARGLDHALRLRLHRVGAAKLPQYAHLPATEADRRHCDDALRQMVECRLRLGLSQPGMARKMGVSYHVVSHIETGGSRKPLLSTWQRYVRALGGNLGLQLVAAPVIDDVAIRRALTGSRSLCELDDAEKVVLFRDFLPPKMPVDVAAEQMKTTPQMVKKWRELAAAA